MERSPTADKTPVLFTEFEEPDPSGVGEAVCGNADTDAAIVAEQSVGGGRWIWLYPGQ